MQSLLMKFTRAGLIACAMLAAATTLSRAEEGGGPNQDNEGNYVCGDLDGCGSPGIVVVPDGRRAWGERREQARGDWVDTRVPRERWRERRSWRDRDRRGWDDNWRRHNRSGFYFNIEPSYRYVEPRRQYRTNGLSRAHIAWCYDRYRSYRAWDNTFKPNYGPRRQCYSPYI